MPPGTRRRNCSATRRIPPCPGPVSCTPVLAGAGGVGVERRQPRPARLPGELRRPPPALVDESASNGGVTEHHGDGRGEGVDVAWGKPPPRGGPTPPPSPTPSGTAPAAVATPGTPAAIASRGGKPNPSYTD